MTGSRSRGLIRFSQNISWILTCAISVTGCLQSDVPLFTAKIADYPFRRNTVFQTYLNINDSISFGEGQIILKDGEYHLIKLPGQLAIN